jgi:hypothetical protein
MAERAALNTLLVILAAAPLVFTIVDFVLAQGNQSLRTEVNQRQHLINQGAQLAHVSQALIRQIAVVAVKERDGRLRELLSRNGVTVNVAPPPPVPPADQGKGG